MFTKVTKKLDGTGGRVELVLPSENNDEWNVALTLTEKTFFEYSNFRRNFQLEIGDDNEQIREAIAVATHVRLRADGTNDRYFVIRTGDTIPPGSTDVTWKLFCDLHERSTNYAGY